MHGIEIQLTPLFSSLLIYKYKHKSKNILANYLGLNSDNQKEFTNDVYWKDLFDNLEFPEFLDKKTFRQ